MDAFETIRREAAALHDKAVGHGGDPWAPWSLATHAAAMLGCPLATLARGDPLPASTHLIVTAPRDGGLTFGLAGSF